jgi:hypothetical protein
LAPYKWITVIIATENDDLRNDSSATVAFNVNFGSPPQVFILKSKEIRLGRLKTIKFFRLCAGICKPT